MLRKRKTVCYFLSAIVIFSMLAPATRIYSQDIVAAEDIGGGSSVFVFRESRKKPQVKAAAGGGMVVRAGRGGASKRIDSSYIARHKRPAAKPGPAGPRRGAANPNLKLSTTLTAKADSLMQSGQTDEAITTYRDALKKNPKNTAASNGLSDALTAKGIEASGPNNTEAGVVYLEEAGKLDSKNDLAFAKLGEIFVGGSQTERGILNYEKALTANPGFTELYVPLGLAYLKTGNIAKAQEYSTKADRVGAATADAMYLRGMVLYKQNKNPEALEAFQKVLSLDPNYSSAEYYVAATYDRLNQSDQSIAMYKKTVENDPEFAPAWYDLGVAYYNAGQYDKAADAYEHSTKADPSNAQGHANLASTYRQQERYADANAEYKQAESLGMKNDPNLYNEWGYCLGKTNEWDKSSARLMTAGDLGHSAIDDSNVGWAYYNAANQAKTNSDDAAAKADYELGKAFLQKAVEKDPKLDAAYLNLGATHNGLGEYQLAVSVLNTAVGLRPDWVLALNQLGVGYRGAGDLNNAIAQFTRATNLDAVNVYGLFNLGSTQYAAGDKNGAKKTQARLNKINPALGSQLGNILAGKVIDKAGQEIKKKIPFKIPY